MALTQMETFVEISCFGGTPEKKIPEKSLIFSWISEDMSAMSKTWICLDSKVCDHKSRNSVWTIHPFSKPLVPNMFLEYSQHCTFSMFYLSDTPISGVFTNDKGTCKMCSVGGNSRNVVGNHCSKPLVLHKVAGKLEPIPASRAKGTETDGWTVQHELISHKMNLMQSYLSYAGHNTLNSKHNCVTFYLCFVILQERKDA